MVGEHLQRGPATEEPVAGDVHHPHAAATELALELVGAEAVARVVGFRLLEEGKEAGAAGGSLVEHVLETLHARCHAEIIRKTRQN